MPRWSVKLIERTPEYIKVEAEDSLAAAKKAFEKTTLLNPELVDVVEIMAGEDAK